MNDPKTPEQPTPTPYDVTLYGATGFTGRQAARYFARHAPPTLRWAIAGRDPDKLSELAARLDRAPDGVVVANALDPDAIDRMCAQTRVVLSTAGPFSRYGDHVVAACVAHGTGYVDITGETPWVRRLIDRHHAQAAQDGTRIVPFCGFDSVPSDIGALALVEHLRRRGTGTARVEAYFSGKGGFNGGTLASAVALGESGDLDEVEDPSLLNPEGRRPDPQAEPDPAGPRSARGRWLAPFGMGPINTRVVRRSRALAAERGADYGPQFSYQEWMDCGRGLKGMAVAAAVGAAMAAFTPLVGSDSGRKLLTRFGPEPGQGPSEEAMDGGFTRARYHAVGDDGSVVEAELFVEGDPGNRATVLMLCEAALALALDAESLPPGGGVLTPASGIGLRLLERLVLAGVRFEVDGRPWRAPEA